MANVIKLEDTLEEILKKMSTMSSGGFNPGGLTVLMSMIENSPTIDPDDAFGGLGPILLMDSWGIYGEKIWMLFKDVCGQNIVTTIGILRSCQLGMISPSKLMAAIENRGNGIDVDELLTLVRQRLPNFQKEL